LPNEITARKTAFLVVDKLNIDAAVSNPNRPNYAVFKLKHVDRAVFVDRLFAMDILHSDNLAGVTLTHRPIYGIGTRKVGKRTKNFEHVLYSFPELNFTSSKNRPADIIPAIGNVLYVSMTAIDQDNVDRFIKRLNSVPSASLRKLTTRNHYRLIDELYAVGREIAKLSRNNSDIAKREFHKKAKTFPSKCEEVRCQTGIDQMIVEAHFKNIVTTSINLRL
jgi:hypothetical protein